MTIFRKQQTTTTNTRKWVYTALLVFISPYTVLLSLFAIPFVWGYRINIGDNKQTEVKDKKPLTINQVESDKPKIKLSKTEYIVIGIVLMGMSNPHNLPYTLNLTQTFLLGLLGTTGVAFVIVGLFKPSKNRIANNAQKKKPIGTRNTN